jgi:predicted RNase H-like nuclease (RuvC/YqgF family)
MYEDLRDAKLAAEENAKQAVKNFNDKDEEMKRQKTELDEEINALKIQVGNLDTAWKDAQRKASEAIAQQNNWRDLNTKFLATNDELRKLLEDKLAQLKEVDAKRIQGDKQLKETTATLIEKMAIIDDLQKETKLLLEEKTDLQNKLGNFLQPSGQAVAKPVSVTALKETARVAVPAVDIGLNGLVTKVDLENSLAQISIGAANGVKQNMKFHVTRADKFICDILILDVEPEKAIGTLELMDVTKEQPKAGDNVSTNL